LPAPAGLLLEAPDSATIAVTTIATILAEYRRAIAAARRHEELTCRRRAGVRRRDIPRRIFEEFYSRMDDGCGHPCLPAAPDGDNARMRCQNRSSGVGRSRWLAGVA
jgi:hypothetical protein